MLMSLFCVTMFLECFRCDEKNMLISLHQDVGLDATTPRCSTPLHHGVFLLLLLGWKSNV